jgi:hypothetical protein
MSASCQKEPFCGCCLKNEITLHGIKPIKGIHTDAEVRFAVAIDVALYQSKVGTAFDDV